MVIVRWVIGALLLLVFALFAFVVWLAMNEDVVSESGEPPLIKAEGLPYKEEPAERGGIAVMNEDSSLVQALDRGPDEAVVERILPAPEPPPRSAAEVLPRATADADTPPADSQQQVAAAGVPAAEPTPPAAPEPIAPAEVEALVSSEPDPQVAPIEPVIAAIPPPAATPAPPVAVDPPAPPARSEPALPRVIAGPAPEGSGAAVVFDPPAATPAPPVQVATVPPTQVPPVPQRGAAATDAYRVQLSALREPEQAEAAWTQLRDRFPEILGDGEVFIVPSETDRGLFYRVQAGLYGSRGDAEAACEAIKTRGGDCFVVRGQN